jgi:hypothetical protein
LTTLLAFLADTLRSALGAAGARLDADFAPFAFLGFAFFTPATLVLPPKIASQPTEYF